MTLSPSTSRTWAAPKGWRYWSAVNNTEVGIWYTATSFAFMLFAGVLGLMIRSQLAVPDNDFLTASFYNQVYTLHGTVMMFLFAVPIFEAVAIILLPQHEPAYQSEPPQVVTSEAVNSER